jgi:hypothetical protein
MIVRQEPCGLFLLAGKVANYYSVLEDSKILEQFHVSPWPPLEQLLLYLNLYNGLTSGGY